MQILAKLTDITDTIRGEFTSLNDMARLGYICAQHGTGKAAIKAGLQEVETNRQKFIESGIGKRYAQNVAICITSESYGYSDPVSDHPAP